MGPEGAVKVSKVFVDMAKAAKALAMGLAWPWRCRWPWQTLPPLPCTHGC